jgi:hypothetical protein
LHLLDAGAPEPGAMMAAVAMTAAVAHPFDNNSCNYNDNSSTNNFMSFMSFMNFKYRCLSHDVDLIDF